MRFSRAAANAPDNLWHGNYFENRHTKIIQMIHYGHALKSTAYGSDGTTVSVELMTWGPQRGSGDVCIRDFSITATLPDGRKFSKTFEIQYMRGMLNGIAWPDRFLDFEIQKCITNVRNASEISETAKPLVIHALEAWIK